MGIRARFTPFEVRRAFAQRNSDVERIMIRQLQVLGEKCVNKARSLDTYKDQTGNLRSSIGYVIYANGRPVGENFKIFKGGASGIEKAKEEIRKFRVTSFGYSLVVVAGMDYAYQVETMGKDVLTSSEQLARIEFPKLMARVLKNITNAS